MAVLEVFYEVAKKLDYRNVVHALIDSQLIDVQISFFMMSMKSKCMRAMDNFGDLNHVTMTRGVHWRKIIEQRAIKK